MTTPDPVAAGTDDSLSAAYAEMCADLARVLPARACLATILGVSDPLMTDLAMPPGQDEYAELVADLTTALPAPAGIEDILGTEHEYHEFVANLATVLDPRRGLPAILATAEEGAMPAKSADDLAEIYRVSGPHRLFLRLGDRHRHLRAARAAIDELLGSLGQVTRGPGPDSTNLNLIPGRLASQHVAIAEAMTLLSAKVLSTNMAPAKGLEQRLGRINREIARSERRTVTVLFTDLVGFTSLIDNLATDELRDLQTDWLSVASGAVRHHGGQVEKYVGDAIMAVFGLSTPTERSAVDAVRAGLELQRALDGRALAGRWSVKARVGVATGEAIVAEKLVSGSVVSRAARIQAYCPHGSVMVSTDTRQATADSIRYLEMPAIKVADQEHPLEVWVALGVAGHKPPADDEHLAQLDNVMREVADELGAMAAEVTAAGLVDPELRRRCLRAASTLARRMDQMWQALSDFRGTDLEAAALSASDLEDLDGVYWSDDTAPGSATRWPESLRLEIVEHSYPFPELGFGVFVIQHGATIGLDR